MNVFLLMWLLISVYSFDSLSHYSLYAGNVYCKPHQRKVEWEDLQAGVKTPVKKGESQ